MTRLYLFITLVSISHGLSAQGFVELSCGAGYAQQAYYRFSDDQKSYLNNDSWDIAFTAFGLQDAGIFINESTASSFTDPQPEVELFLAPTPNFNDPIDTAMLLDRRYNDEKTWFYGGFNTERDTLNPLDFGWGSYDPGSFQVLGQRVFVIKLRNGNYKKISIDSLVINTYYLRWADLDGSNEVAFSINKTEHSAAGFAYLSINQGKLVDIAPVDWDLFWGRHTTPLDDGQGGIIEYNVTGVLSGPGISVAEADNVDPLEVDFYNDGYNQLLSSDPTIIGSDWKFFDFSAGWIIDSDRVFFVKTRDNHIWQMIIVDFEGISTGNMVFDKADLGILSSLESSTSLGSAPLIGPNPSRQGQEIFMDWQSEGGQSRLSLLNLQGQVVWTQSMMLNRGFQIIGQLPDSLPAGTYILSLEQGANTWSRPWIIVRS